MNKRAKYYGRLFDWLPVIEGVLLFAAVYLAVLLRIGTDTAEIRASIGPIWPEAAVFSAILLLSITAVGLYNRRLRDGFEGIVVRLVLAFVAGMMAIALVYYAFPHIFLGRGVLLLSLLIGFFLLLVLRAEVLGIARREEGRRRVLVLGTGKRAEVLSRLRRRTDLIGLRIVGYVPHAGDTLAVPETGLVEVEGPLSTWAVDNGIDEIVVDNLGNGSLAALRAVEAIAGRGLSFHPIDIRDRDGLADVFAHEAVDAVFHFAALKAVGESVTLPLRYFDNNIGGMITLCQAMIDAGVDTFIFSSSATVYGVPERVPVDEHAPLAVTNPYGRTKLVNEEMLRDLQAALPALRVALLRYFNPGGAHPSGMIGESPHDIPNNLLPFVSQVAAGRLDRLRIHGDDYPTPDGTGVRDYIHVVDLARGHLAALAALVQPGGAYVRGGVLTANLGTGRGYSVLEIVRAFETASGRPIAYVIGPRRPGDVAACYADPGFARERLGWSAALGIGRICEDAWRWQRLHPTGFEVEGHAA